MPNLNAQDVSTDNFTELASTPKNTSSIHEQAVPQKHLIFPSLKLLIKLNSLRPNLSRARSTLRTRLYLSFPVHTLLFSTFWILMADVSWSVFLFVAVSQFSLDLKQFILKRHYCYICVMQNYTYVYNSIQLTLCITCFLEFYTAQVVLIHYSHSKDERHWWWVCLCDF
jgi:hypothetical protein